MARSDGESHLLFIGPTPEIVLGQLPNVPLLAEPPVGQQSSVIAKDAHRRHVAKLAQVQAHWPRPSGSDFTGAVNLSYIIGRFVQVAVRGEIQSASIRCDDRRIIVGTAVQRIHWGNVHADGLQHACRSEVALLHHLQRPFVAVIPFWKTLDHHLCQCSGFGKMIGKLQHI